MKAPNSLLVALTGVALVWCPPVRAEPPQLRPESKSPPVISVQFPGGTLAEYLEAIRNAAGGANVVLAAPEARKVSLPSIRLNSVAVGAAVRVVAGEVRVDGLSLRIHVEEIGPSDEGEQPIYRVSAVRQGRPPSTDVMVWTLAGLLTEETKAEDVLTAIETSVGLLGEKYEPAQVRFHEATGLLLACGEHQQLAAIDNVVDGLRNGLAQLRGAAQEDREASLKQAEMRIIELERKVLLLSGGLQRKESRIRELENRLNEPAKK